LVVGISNMDTTVLVAGLVYEEAKASGAELVALASMMVAPLVEA
jgi:hypothetical protein